MTRRNKVDGQGKHPWKAEVSEDDSGVSPTVITGWYDEEMCIRDSLWTGL